MLLLRQVGRLHLQLIAACAALAGLWPGRAAAQELSTNQFDLSHLPVSIKSLDQSLLSARDNSGVPSLNGVRSYLAAVLNPSTFSESNVTSQVNWWEASDYTTNTRAILPDRLTSTAYLTNTGAASGLWPIGFTLPDGSKAIRFGDLTNSVNGSWLLSGGVQLPSPAEVILVVRRIGYSMLGTAPHHYFDSTNSSFRNAGGYIDVPYGSRSHFFYSSGLIQGGAMDNLNQWMFLDFVFNGASSSLLTNLVQDLAGNPGNTSCQGFTLGANYQQLNFGTFELILCRTFNAVLSAANRTNLFNRVRERYPFITLPNNGQDTILPAGQVGPVTVGGLAISGSTGTNLYCPAAVGTKEVIYPGATMNSSWGNGLQAWRYVFFGDSTGSGYPATVGAFAWRKAATTTDPTTGADVGLLFFDGTLALGGSAVATTPALVPGAGTLELVGADKTTPANFLFATNAFATATSIAITNPEQVCISASAVTINGFANVVAGAVQKGSILFSNSGGSSWTLTLPAGVKVMGDDTSATGGTLQCTNAKMAQCDWKVWGGYSSNVWFWPQKN